MALGHVKPLFVQIVSWYVIHAVYHVLVHRRWKRLHHQICEPFHSQSQHHTVQVILLRLLHTPSMIHQRHSRLWLYPGMDPQAHVFVQFICCWSRWGKRWDVGPRWLVMEGHQHWASEVVQFWLQSVSHPSWSAVLWRALTWFPVAMPCGPGRQFSFLKLLLQIFCHRRRNMINLLYKQSQKSFT